MDRTNRVYDPKLTDIEKLLVNLFHPARQKEELSWESDEDEGLIEPELEDETLYGDESEYSAYGVKSGEHICGAQRSNFYSRKQIFPIPQQKRKEK